MATQTIIFAAPYTPTAANARPLGGGSVVNGSSITQLTDGLFSAQFSSLAGDYTLSILDGSRVLGLGVVFDVTNTAATFYEADLVQPSSGGSSGSGSGAYTLTVTVNDGTTALQNAIVRLTEGSNTYTATTNASGIATFALDAATYSVAITKPGYQFTPTTLAVSSTASQTYSMSATSITPGTSTTTTGYMTVTDMEDAPAAGITVQVQILKYANGSTAVGIDNPIASQVSDAAGLVEFPGLPRLATYQVRIGTSGKWFKGTTEDATTTELVAALGNAQ